MFYTTVRPGKGTMRKKSNLFIWESVIGLGFLSGIWTTIGISPQSVLLGLMEKSTESIYPDPVIRVLFVLLPTLLLVISIVTAYRRGRVTGLFSVILAYLGGLSILISLLSALLLLGCAIVIGIIATKR
jgi:hypothetical protein